MFRVKCPICRGVLTIDERLRRVISHVTHEDTRKDASERFEDVVDKLQKSEASRDERLEAAKEREARRKSHLDDLFKKARDKAKDAGDDGKPLGPVWD